MDQIIEIVSNTPETRKRNDDDFADRLSSRYTVVILVVFALIVSGAAYFGENITCWAPKHFEDSHIAYANAYCWVRNTYYLPYEDDIPKEDEERQTIRYYQWIPFILLGQAVLFYMPTLAWHGMNSRGGIDTDNILDTAHTLSRTDKEERREEVITFIANQMDRFLRSRRQNNSVHCDCRSILNSPLCKPCNRRLGVYLVLLFMFSKLLYIANVIGQMYLLNSILGMSFSTFGFDAPNNIMSNHAWDDAAHVAFPRVTMCDFEIRRMGNVHRYTLQCTLPINMYTEKMYLFLWFWMVMVAALSCYSFLMWTFRILTNDRHDFIRNNLLRGRQLVNKDLEKKVTPFVVDYLKRDGCFLLRLIAHNTNSITTTDIVGAVWQSWLERQALQNGKVKDIFEEPVEPITADFMPS